MYICFMKCLCIFRNIVDIAKRLSLVLLPWQLIFEALRGSGFMGDIALDDIIVLNGACPAPGRTFGLVRLL